MNRNEKVKYFMHDARGCSNPKNLDYETMGGDSKIEARKYIIYLEKENKKLKLSARAEGVFDAISTIPSAHYFGSNFVSLTALNNFGVSLKQKAEKL
jgi:hypothetical protein